MFSDLYPGARIIPAMKIWKLPKGKESELSTACSSGEYFLEEKIDGYWYEYEKTKDNSYLFSRNISKETGVLTEKGDRVPHLMNALSCLPPETILIGEVYVPGGTSKTVTKYLGCLAEEAIKRQEKDGLVHYYIHDLIYYDGVNLLNSGAEERYKILQAIYKLHELDNYDFLHLAVKVENNLEEEISRILNSGGEGAVLKKRTAPYTPDGRPAHDTIKIKQMDSIDLVCVGICPPTKEYTGKEIETWPYWCKKEKHGLQKISLICMYGEPEWIPITKYYAFNIPSAIEIGAYDNNGNIKKLGTVSSGLTDEDKQNMGERPDDYLGKVVSLDCMSISKTDKTLRHPVFKSWRTDKDAKDCLISEVFK